MKRIALMAALLIGCMAYGDPTARAVELLKGLEGFKPSVYRCEAGRSTIGYGFTSRELIAKKRMTDAEATTELYRLCGIIRARLVAEMGKGSPLTECQEAAIISFIYNVGWGNFKASTLCRLLKEGKRGAIIGVELRKWVYVSKGGKKVVSKGLVNRRGKEAVKFLVG